MRELIIGNRISLEVVKDTRKGSITEYKCTNKSGKTCYLVLGAKEYELKDANGSLLKIGDSKNIMLKISI